LCFSFTMNNCSYDAVNTFANSLQLVVYIPTFALGLILNSLALFVFCIQLRKWTESTIYMTNLSLMDLLLLLSLPFKMHASQNEWSVNKKMFCTFLESLYFVSTYGSIYTIMCISIDRYIAIKHPFKAKVLRSPKKALIVCAVIWVVVWTGTSPVYSFHKDKDANLLRCFHGFSEESWNPAVIINLEIFGFLIPMLVMVFCSIQIIRTLKQSQRNPDMQNNKTCIRIIYANLFVFLVSFTPSHLGIYLQFLVRQNYFKECNTTEKISLFVQITMCLANITCCLDAICYYFITKELRSSSKDNIRRFRSHRVNTIMTEATIKSS
uniref:G protein-coupled receptor 55 n=1 Tax=Lepisosteus oculatus TaxID=7918 RepID=W5MAM3_LEPOC